MEKSVEVVHKLFSRRALLPFGFHGGPVSQQVCDLLLMFPVDIQREAGVALQESFERIAHIIFQQRKSAVFLFSSPPLSWSPSFEVMVLQALRPRGCIQTELIKFCA